MARKPKDVTEAELAVLQVLWQRGPSTRRQITDILYAEDPPAQYTTVQKLLDRLESKGYVRQDRSSGVLVFDAIVARDKLISQRLLGLAAELCDGSVTPLLMNLVRVKPLSEDELDSLRRLLDELRRQPRPRSKRR